MKIKGRVQIRKSTKNKLMAGLRSTFGDEVEQIQERKIETAMADDFPIVIIDGKVLLFQVSDTYFPTVRGVLELGLRKNVVMVDSGAIRFVVNGADIMSPGITSADPEIQPNDPVIIVEETHDKPLAIGISLLPGSEMVANSGKAIKSVHYVGDKLWNLEL
ncbi:RNA-binding protein [Methanolobus sp. ZRKC3]|uniref:RNA-binding protein n=1 Tax=Methanolobus sp. ZRKC3 TaxID=3125786 RepID=UPI003255B101